VCLDSVQSTTNDTTHVVVVDGEAVVVVDSGSDSEVDVQWILDG
jgi:hypothetical protein